MNNFTDKLSKFLKLNISQKFIVTESILLLTISTSLLKIFGFRTTHFILDKLPTFLPSRNLDKTSIENRQKLLISTSKAVPFNTRCIHEAITLWTMLKLRGRKSYLKIGIKNDYNEFNSHAWIEVNGEVIGESEHLKTDYREFEHKFFINKKNANN